MRTVVLLAWLASLPLLGCSKPAAQTPPPSKPPSPLQPSAPAPEATTHEQQAEIILDAMDRLAAEVAQIETTDVATAQVPHLERQADELRYAIQRLNDMSKLHGAELERKKGIYADRVKSTVEKYNLQVRRIRGHSQLKPLTEVATRMFSARGKLRGTMIEPPAEKALVGFTGQPGFGGPPPGFPGPPPGFPGPPPGFPGPPPGIQPPPGFAPAPAGGIDESADAMPDLVVLDVVGIPSGKFNRVTDLVRALNDFRSYQASGTNGKGTYQLRGIEDFESLSERIHFGEIVETDKKARRIKVEIDPQKLP